MLQSFWNRTVSMPARASLLVIGALLLAMLMTGSSGVLAQEGGGHDDRPRFAGIWSDGSFLWVADWEKNEIQGYATDGRTRLVDKTIDLDRPRGDGVFPQGLWSNGTTLWVVDTVGDRVVSYTLSTGEMDKSKEFSLHSTNDKAYGIWSDGAKVYISDRNRRIYVYDFNGTRDESSEFTVPSGVNPKGIWSNGRIMWVVDASSNSILAFDMDPDYFGTRQPSWDIALSGANNPPGGLWSDGEGVWTTKTAAAASIHLYQLGLAPIDLDAQNTHVSGIWSDGSVMYISDWGDENIYAYDTIANRLPSLDIDTLGDDDNNDVHGIWSNGRTMYALDSLRSRIYAYNMSTRERDSDKDIRLASDNDHPTGLWGDVDNMLVADTENNIVYAYLNWNKAYNPGLNISLTANTGVFGVWTDGSTLWAVDGDDEMIFAYAKSNGDRRPEKDIRLHAENTNARGMWGQGGVIMVLDGDSNQVFRYKIPGVGGL